MDKALILASGRTSRLLRVATMLWVRKAFRMCSTLPLKALRAQRKRVWRQKARAPRERKVRTGTQCKKVLQLAQEKAWNQAAKHSMLLFVLKTQLIVRNTANVSVQSKALWAVLRTTEDRLDKRSKLAARVIWFLRQLKTYNFLSMRCQNKSLNYNTQKLNQANQ